MNTRLFNSLYDPIPGLRGDLEIIPVQHEGRDYLYFYDMLGYVTPNFIIERSSAQIIALFDGKSTIDYLLHEFNQGENVIRYNDVLNFVQFLDKNCILYSDYFRQEVKEKENTFEKLDVRPPICAGSSYPAEKEEIIRQFDAEFEKYNSPDSLNRSRKIKALYAPHIDPRVGMASYVKAFAPLRDLKPERVVVLATSHYSGLYRKTYTNKPFIISSKHFDTPLGRITNDRQAFNELRQSEMDLGCSFSDRAHRIEHSIELHLINLRYLWKHDFKILPILVGSFDELLYMEHGHRGQQVKNLADYLFKKYGSDDDTLFLISGDLAHFGKKFGDSVPARTLFEEVRQFDNQFLDRARQGNSSLVLDLVKEVNDRYRICGFPPLLTFLKAMPGITGQITSYDLWDESERESAVTFGSILFTE